MREQESYLAKAQESLAGAESEYQNLRYNNAASRAYFAAFQAATAALLDAQVPLGTEPEGWASHARVQSAFAGILIGRRNLYRRDLRGVLQRLIDDRIRADYWPVAISQTRSWRGFELAKQLVQAVAQRLSQGN